MNPPPLGKAPVSSLICDATQLRALVEELRAFPDYVPADEQQRTRAFYQIDLIEKLLPNLPMFPGAKPRQPRGRPSHMQELIGRTVTAVWISPDAERLIFNTDDGYIAYRAEGWCCSYSYFNDIIGLDNLIDHTVSEVEEVGLLDVETEDTHDVVAYGIKLTTDRGYVDIVYRNVSNGYYGGYYCLDLFTGVPEDYLQLCVDDWSRDG